MTCHATTVTRAVLYDQVWAKPMTKLAKEYGVSDVALKKACAKADIPVPAQGYWNKLEHGKQVAPRPALPQTVPGYSDTVTVTRTPSITPPTEMSPALAAFIQSLTAGDTRIRVSTEMRDLHPAVWPKTGRLDPLSSGMGRLLADHDRVLDQASRLPASNLWRS